MWILAGILFIVSLAVAVAVTMRVLVDDTKTSKYSKHTISKFVPDNTAPKLTDMIEYHKTHDEVRYVVGE